MLRYGQITSDKRYHCRSGEKILPKYVLDFPEKGGVCLKQCGEIDHYTLIQKRRVDCDIAKVLESVVKNEPQSVVDMDSLNTLVADFVTVNNLGELYNATKRIETTWDDTPLEVRQQFDGDIRKFVRSIGTEDWNQKVSAGYQEFRGKYHVTPGLTNKPDVPVYNPDNNTFIDQKVSDQSSNVSNQGSPQVSVNIPNNGGEK